MYYVRRTHFAPEVKRKAGKPFMCLWQQVWWAGIQLQANRPQMLIFLHTHLPDVIFLQQR